MEFNINACRDAMELIEYENLDGKSRCVFLNLLDYIQSFDEDSLDLKQMEVNLIKSNYLHSK